MKVGTRYQKFQDAFFSWGWLLPALFPASQIGGRALFNVLDYSYALWGLLSCPGRSVGADRGFVVGYLLLLGAFLLSVFGAEEFLVGLRAWGQFVLQSAIGILTLLALRQDPENLGRLRYALGLGGFFMLFWQYVALVYYWQSGAFEPQQLRDGNLPFLLPFMLAWVATEPRLRPWRGAAFGSIILLAFSYIVLSHGRTSLVAAIIALTGFGILIWRWSWRRTLLFLLVIAVLAAALILGPLRKLPVTDLNLLDLGTISSGRTLIWEQALKNPPEQPWLGVGMGHGSFASEVLTFELAGQQHQVRHLHNLLLDVWYETGLLGVGTLVFFIGYVLMRAVRNWFSLNSQERETLGLFMIAALAILTGTLLDFNYTSRYFSCYFFLCLGVIHFITTQAKSRSVL